MKNSRSETAVYQLTLGAAGGGSTAKKPGPERPLCLRDFLHNYPRHSRFDSADGKQVSLKKMVSN
jgi:hypothetical protein